jgi:hypothetical protein
MQAPKETDGAKFIAIFDKRFTGLALTEINKLLNHPKMRKVGGDRALNLFEVEPNKLASGQTINRNAFTFVEAFFRLEGHVLDCGDDYSNIVDFLSKLVKEPRFGSFNLEVKIFNSHVGENAKSLEVKVGSALENSGHRIDMNDPSSTLYLLFLRKGEGVLICSSSGEYRPTLDMARYYKKTLEARISRAEYKLLEALLFFQVPKTTDKVCLDIGSAPGGWADVLLRSCGKVVAIDNALLDYASLSETARISILCKPEEKDTVQNAVKGVTSICSVSEMSKSALSKSIKGADITHIKSNSSGDLLKLLESAPPFNMLTMDANVEPVETAAIINSLCILAEPKSILIATIKLPHGMIPTVEKAVGIISGSYDGIRLKKLQHNRRELTLFGIKKG